MQSLTNYIITDEYNYMLWAAPFIDIEKAALTYKIAKETHGEGIKLFSAKQGVNGYLIFTELTKEAEEIIENR